jgi:hypothetical protein
MNILNWTNAKIRKMTWVQVAVIELCVAAFALLIAKLWPGVLGLQWYWYAAASGLSYLYLMAFMLKR